MSPRLTYATVAVSYVCLLIDMEIQIGNQQFVSHGAV